jgi:hypothetical protein
MGLFKQYPLCKVKDTVLLLRQLLVDVRPALFCGVCVVVVFLVPDLNQMR